MSGIYTYFPKGVCSTQFDIALEDGKIKHINISGGCDGNLQGITRLIIGMDARDVILKMEGIGCGSRKTSCPDQISRALRQILERNEPQMADM